MRVEHWVYTIPLRLKSLFRRRAAEQELDEELAHHIALLTEQHQARGMSPAEARRAARIAMGGTERRKDECRDARHTDRVETMVRDIRFALRSLRRAPGFTAMAVLTLTLGIGANAAIFTVVNGVLLRPLGYAEPHRLVLVRSERMETVAPANFIDWRASARSFQSMGLAQYWNPALTDGDRPEDVVGVHVSATLLTLLGVRPALGRTFTPDDERDGSNQVVVLGNALWRTRYGADANIIGRTITLNGTPYTVVGVMPPGFQFVPFWASNAQLAAPFTFGARASDRTGASLRVIGRLAPGATIEGAQREMATIAARLEQQYPGTNAPIRLMSLQERVVGNVRPALLVLLAAVALVLLIACANVAHLQLLRAAAREREMAVRTALGASRGRLVQQSLIESVMLAIAGGVLGTLVALAGVRLLVRLAPPQIPRLDAISVDGRVLAFVALLTAVASLVFGAAPALAASRSRVMGSLREGGRGGSDGVRRRRVRSALVISEVALALMLLVGAGLVLRSFIALVRVDPGFDPRGLLSMKVSLRGTEIGQSSERRALFFRELLDRVRMMPGVRDGEVSAINHLPLHGDQWGFTFAVEGRPLAPPGQEPQGVFRITEPGYFRAMRVPLLQGRDFVPVDGEHGAKVVIINQAFAERHWPNASALGKRVTVDDAATHPSWYTVVGVVKNTKQQDWSAAADEEIYFPYTPTHAPAAGASAPRGVATSLAPEYMTLVVRAASGDAAALAQPIERVVREMNRGAPVSDVITMEQVVSTQLASPTFYLLVLGTFAAVALMLAAVGVYGVISYATTRRTHEIGVRMALGASAREAFAMVVRGGLQLTGIGMLAGVLAALGATRFLGSLLYGVGATDLPTFVTVTALLGVVALAACAIPAWRASRIEPVRALKSE